MLEGVKFLAGGAETNGFCNAFPGAVEAGYRGLDFDVVLLLLGSSRHALAALVSYRTIF